MDEQQDLAKRARVAIIGCGDLSAYAVYSLLSSDEINEVVLVGELPDRLDEEVSQLHREVHPNGRAKYRTGQIQDAACAEIVVIGAEAACEADIEQESLRVTAIARQLFDLGFDGVLLITVDPVDAMLRAALQAPIPTTRIIGLGSNSQNPHTGRVGTSVWCTGAVNDVPFTDLCDPECPYFPKVLEGSRRFWNQASASSDASHSSHDDVAICVTRVCEAILSARRSLIPLWTVSPAGVPKYAMYIGGNRGILPAATFIAKDRSVSPVEVV